MSSDCQFFSIFIEALNNNKKDSSVPANCCEWDKLECDSQGNIIKLDLSSYKFPYTGALPQTVESFSHLKEFSISGQKGITDIYHIQYNELEKVDLSNSGIKAQSLPLWIAKAPKLKEVDISGTEISGAPQEKFVSSLTNCNFSSTPLCNNYQSSPYAGNVPDICITSCTKGGASKIKISKDSEGSSSILPYILIGVAAVLIIALCAFLYLKKSKKNNEFYEEYAQSHSNNNIKRDDSVEISVNDKAPLSPKGNLPTTTAVNNNQSYNNQSYNNQSYNNSPVNGKNMNYNGNVSVDPEQSFQPHPSIYNTMTTDVDSDEEDDSNIVNQPIVSGNQDIPALLRRKSSRKTPISEAAEVQEANPQNYVPQGQEDLYIANWDYTPTLSDELALTAGDVIEIKKKFDDGWCTGYNRRTNLTGIVPLCYLKEYED